MADVLRDIDTIEAESSRKRRAAEDNGRQLVDAYWKELGPLLKRRELIVTGKSEPTEGELENFEEPDPADSRVQHVGGKVPQGIPYFWLTVLSNQDAIAELITRRDEEVLQHLEDVRLVRSRGGGSVVEFVFRPNPCFRNRILRRGVVATGNGPNTGVLGSGVVEETTDIEWKAGKNLTVRQVVKKNAAGKKGKKKGTGAGNESEAVPVIRVKPCPSFFRFFAPAIKSRKMDPSAIPDDSDGEKETTERSLEAFAASIELLRKLEHVVIPDAAFLYTSGPLKSAAAGDSGDDSDGGFEMVGAGAESLEALPLPVQRRVAALQALQRQSDEARQRLWQRELDVKVDANKSRAACSAQRREALVRNGELVVPFFWVKALKALDTAVQAIHRRDEAALESLADVSVLESPTLPGSAEGPTTTVQLEFLPNPYFAYAVLTKTYRYGPMPLDPSKEPILVSIENSAVEWKGGQDLTAVQSGARRTPASSFFCLFSKGGAKHAFGIVGEGRDASQDAQMLEEELLDDFRVAAQRAGQLHRSMAALVIGEGGDETDDDEIEGSDEGGNGSSEDEDAIEGEGAEAAAAAKSRSRSRKASKGAKSWLRCSPGIALAAMILLTVGIQLFMIMEQFLNGK